METFRYLREGSEFNRDEYYSPDTVEMMMGMDIPKEQKDTIISKYRIPKEILDLRDFIKKEFSIAENGAITDSSDGVEIKFPQTWIFLTLDGNGNVKRVSTKYSSTRTNIGISNKKEIASAVERSLELTKEYDSISKKKADNERELKRMKDEILRLETENDSLEKRMKEISRTTN